MKKKRNLLIIPLLLMGMFILLANSCKKDDEMKTTTVTDVDGNVYTTVTIGTQVWMVENLKTTKYRDGTTIPNITENVAWFKLTTGAYCDYNNTPANSDKYGRLYNWYAATDARNICPTGWHVPTNAEWTTLITHLGGEGFAGGQLKEIETTHWQSPNTGATNEAGFTALPGGNRIYGNIFTDIGKHGSWWSATRYDDTFIWLLNLQYNSNSANRYSYREVCGVSIRCIKD